MKKPFWHELPDAEIEKLIKKKVKIGYVLKNYAQPSWCTYPEALGGIMGCWSLTDNFDLRHSISPEYCKGCDCKRSEMRPIKFRAWSYSLQKMVYVSIEAMEAGLYPLDSSWDECIRPFDSEDSDCELMQFTGLLDKNGKEIWEGDIFKWRGHEVQNGKQIRPERKWLVEWDFETLFKTQNLIRNNGTVEVIGNIWENPSQAP